MSRSKTSATAVTRRQVCIVLTILMALGETAFSFQSAVEPPVLTEVQKDRLKERDAFEKETLEHEREGRFAEAIVAAGRMLEIEQQVLGLEHDDSVRSLELIARLQTQTYDFSGAKESREKLLAIRTKISGPEHWRTADAKRAVTQVEFLSTLPPNDRKQLNESSALNSTAIGLFREGKTKEALPLFAQVADIRKQILGANHPDYGISLNNLAYLTDELGDSEKAETLYLQVLQVYRSSLGDKHPEFATALVNVAKIYEARGEFSKAEPLLLQAVEINRSALGEKDLSFAVTLSNLAGLYDSMAQFAKAEPLYIESLEIRKTLHGEESYEYFTALNNLAVLYASTGQNQKAEKLLRQALEINRKLYGDFHPLYATSLNNLAAILKAMGDLEEAEPLYVESLEIRRKLFGEKHPDFAHSLNNLATLHVALGDNARAEPLFRQALEIKRATLGEKHPDYATGLNNLAEIYKANGDFVQAEPLLREALEIQKNTIGERHPDYANTLSNLAMMYALMGDASMAESLFTQALEIRKVVFGEHHTDYAISVNNLADLYNTTNQPEKAEPLFQQALEINRAALGESHPDFAINVGNLGSFYFAKGDYAKAEPLFQRSIEIKRAALGDQHPGYATGLSNLAMLYEVRGDIEKAEPLFQQAHTIFQSVCGKNHPNYAISLSNLGRLKASVGQYALAKSLIQESVVQTRTHIEATAAVQSERQQFLMDMAGKSSLDLYLSVAVSSGEYSDDVYEEVLASKGSVWRRQQKTRTLQTEPELTPLFAELQSVAARRAKQTLHTPAPDGAEEWRKQLDQLAQRQDEIEKILASRSAAFKSFQSPITVAEIRASLPDKHVLVDFIEYDQLTKSADAAPGVTHLEKHLAAFVLRPDVPNVKLIPLGEVKAISAAIETWRLSYGQSSEAQKAGQLLRDRIWMPVQAFLEDTQTVLVSPDGVLGRFSLVALPGNEAGSFLLEERAIAIVPFPQALTYLLSTVNSDRAAVDGNLLVLGNVDYDTRPEGVKSSPATKKFGRHLAGVRGAEWRSFTPLPATRGEVASIDKLYRGLFGNDGVMVLEQTNASEARFREEATRHKFLHIATHGFFAPISLRSALEHSVTRSASPGSADGTERYVGVPPGMLSGLVFAGANRDPEGLDDDGILTASEVESLDLRGVDLTLLSACETGLGEVTGGEGLLGLQRSFHIAGARSVVASLWEVSDEATRSLMENFYDNLWNKELSMLESLRQAQLSMLKEGRQRGLVRLDQPQNDDSGKRTPPFYWAAFVLSGDWR